MTDWMDSANCASTDPSLFFPKVGENANAARKICAACPVAGECLEYAIDNCFDDGVYGGLTPDERRKLSQPKVRT